MGVAQVITGKITWQLEKWDQVHSYRYRHGFRWLKLEARKRKYGGAMGKVFFLLNNISTKRSKILECMITMIILFLRKNPYCLIIESSSQWTNPPTDNKYKPVGKCKILSWFNLKKIHITVPSKNYNIITKGQGGIWKFMVERFLYFTWYGTKRILNSLWKVKAVY